MAEVSEAKLNIVRGLIEQAPDKAVATLLMALTADGGRDPAFAKVKAMLVSEAMDRKLRNQVLAPLIGLCEAPTAFTHIGFPTSAIAQVWRGLGAVAQAQVDEARSLAAGKAAEARTTEVFDDLCGIAAQRLRRRDQRHFVAAAESADSRSGAETLARCLDLAGLTRRAVAFLPAWLGAKMSEDHAASLRLAYRDAANIADDGGLRFFEMLASHLDEPWRVLRLIAGAMSRPSDTYLAASELGAFGERVLEDIDRQLAILRGLPANLSREGAAAAAGAAQLALLEIGEIQTSLKLTPEGPWSTRLADQRRTLALLAESHLNAIDAAIDRALPMQAPGPRQRGAKPTPRLTLPPDPAAMATASAYLWFAQDVRASANAGGFATAHAKIAKITEMRLDAYVEDILHVLRSEVVRQDDHARALLEAAAELIGVIRDEKAAERVRRRAAV